ncbi:MAG TPA: OsmC family protein [Propionibacteriaceae bacterium]|nr:OsmC family protein [Propionibacteriaceae bacterium]
MLTHTYETHLTWSGSTAGGYRAYSRTHQGVTVPPTQELTLTADKAFRGDPSQLNPEQLLVLAASSCQMLSFLSIAARQGVTVVGYTDTAHGWMDMADKPERVGRIRIDATIEVEGDVSDEEVVRIAHQAHEECFIANSLTSAMELAVTVVRR